MKIKHLSPVTTLKASIAKDDYKHILSSRRQVYINPDDMHKLPEIIKIIYEEIAYFVYPSTDAFKCFVCKMEGHLAKHCTAVSTENLTNQTVDTPAEM